MDSTKATTLKFNQRLPFALVACTRPLPLLICWSEMEWSAALWRAPGKLMGQSWAGLGDNLYFFFQEIHDLDLTHALSLV